MKNLFALFIVLFTFNASINLSVAAEGLKKKDYYDIYSMQGTSSANWPAVKACLANWGHHPFKDIKSVKFRVIKTSVSVFGIGGTAISDKVKTGYPQLVLIRPAVSVMSKSVYDLLNPNGWYCFDGQVNVMGKAIINIACKTQIGSSKDTVTVMGKSEGESGTTVMGKTVINRTCKSGNNKKKKPLKV
jgi:hypothetical protein